MFMFLLVAVVRRSREVSPGSGGFVAGPGHFGNILAAAFVRTKFFWFNRFRPEKIPALRSLAAREIFIHDFGGSQKFSARPGSDGKNFPRDIFWSQENLRPQNLSMGSCEPGVIGRVGPHALGRGRACGGWADPGPD